MAVQPKSMAADELLRLPRDGQRHELVRGKLRTMPPARFEHGRHTSKLDRSLGSFVETMNLGQVVAGDIGFRLTTGPDTVRAPDVAFVRAERVRAAGRVTGYWEGAPDLVLEVISPNDLYSEDEDKVAEWLEHGARLVFVVNPRRRTVAVHRPNRPLRMLTIDDTLDGEDVVPGWMLPLWELFGERPC